MSEESTTPDLVELTRRMFEAANRRDLDAAQSFYAPDAVWDAWEVGTFEGRAAIRGFWEDWIQAYEKFEIEPEEILDLGWAHHGHSNTRDIPRGAFFHMDVATLHLYPTVPWELVPPYLPTNLKDFFKDKGTYVLDVLVAADNTRPRTISVQFAYDPEIPALKDILWRRNAQFPWWSWWRRLRSRWQTRRPR